MEMSIPPLAAGPLAINLDQPGSYLHWSIFNVSVANLVLIAVMVVIFGGALLLPFPKGKTFPAELSAVGPAAGEPLARGDEAGAGAARGAGGGGDAAMWTARVRGRALALLPPGELLAGRQAGDS